MPSSRKKQKIGASAKSEELGTDVSLARVNSKTGRPMRDSAGKRTRTPGYFDSTEVIDADELSSSGSEDDEGVKKSSRKRKRTPSPSPPPLSPLFKDPDEVPTPEASPEPVIAKSKTPSEDRTISLSFEIPPGFKGPFVVNLSASSLEHLQSLKCRRVSNEMGVVDGAEDFQVASKIEDTQHGNPRTCKAAKSKDKSCRNSDKPFPLLKLPAELRNKIYREVLVGKDSIVDFGRSNGFSRSGGLLRTCKQVHTEGRSILYNENQFFFQRDLSTRKKYWQNKAEEIGYKDVRLFLKSIGPVNISLLRDITWTFEDAPPSVTPRLSHGIPTQQMSHRTYVNLKAEERRFVYDQHLLDCLRLLGQHSKLKAQRLFFHGRKMIDRADFKFLEKLQAVKCDELEFLTLPPSVYRYTAQPVFTRGWEVHKISCSIRLSLSESMVREAKLYSDE